LAKGSFSPLKSARRSATVTISAPLASNAARINSGDENFPVPKIKREENSRSAIVKGKTGTRPIYAAKPKASSDLDSVHLRWQCAVFYGIVLRCLERFASWFPTWNRLVSDLEQAGFRQAQGGKGSHRKFRHPSLRGSILLGGAAADDAKYYQEKQIRNAIGKLTK